MFKKIAVAFDDSPEAGHALVSAIRLAKALGVGLETITVMEKLPSYTAYATGADAEMLATLEQDRSKYYERIQATARELALREGVHIETHLADGEIVDGIVSFVRAHKMDLLVMGLHRRPGRISRLWSTISSIAHNVPCAVLGVP